MYCVRDVCVCVFEQDTFAHRAKAAESKYGHGCVSESRVYVGNRYIALKMCVCVCVCVVIYIYIYIYIHTYMNKYIYKYI